MIVKVVPFDLRGQNADPDHFSVYFRSTSGDEMARRDLYTFTPIYPLLESQEHRRSQMFRR